MGKVVVTVCAALLAAAAACGDAGASGDSAGDDVAAGDDSRDGGGPLGPDGASDVTTEAAHDSGAAGDSGGAGDSGDAASLIDAGCGHTSFPPITEGNTFILPHAQLATVTYAGYEFQSQAEAFGDFVVGSQWIDTVGAQYGVGQGTHVAKVRIATAAPSSMTDADVASMLLAKIGDGTLPAPSPPSTNDVLYAVYIPSTTTFTGPAGIGNSCSSWVGYHSYAMYGGSDFPYLVVADCAKNLDSLTLTASHELIEAATDPFTSTWSLEAPRTSPWSLLDGDEVADLCGSSDVRDYVREDGYILARAYSNSVLAECGSPCTPAAPGAVYFNVSASPADVPAVPAGGTLTFSLTGWATSSSAPDWALSTAPAPSSSFNPKPQLSSSTIGVGKSVTLELSVPAGTPSGAVAGVLVYSGSMGNSHRWPVAIAAK